MADVRLSLEERKIILKWCFKFENVVEVQRHWSREFGTQPPTRLTISRIRDKFEAYGTVCDVHKGKSGRPRTATSAASSAVVLEQFTRSPQKSTTQCARETGVSSTSIRRILKRAIVAKSDLSSLTSRSILKKLEENLSCDLKSRKKEVDKLIMAEVEDQTNSHSEEEEEEVSEEEVHTSKKKADSDSDAEVEDGDEKDDDDDYPPKKKGGRKPKGGGKKRKNQDDDDSDDDWNRKKPVGAQPLAVAKKGPGAAGGRGKKVSAFTKSFKLSPELADVVGSDVMPRHEVVKKLWAVIKERELQDPKNKQYAICDDQLMKVFGIKRFRTFGMMKHLKDHFLEAA